MNVQSKQIHIYIYKIFFLNVEDEEEGKHSFK